MTDQIPESLLTVIWQSIQNGGTEFWIFLIIFTIFLIRQDIPSLIKDFGAGVAWVVKNIFMLRIFKKKEITYKNVYNKESLINHQVFKDLEYWQKVGINTIKITDNKAKEMIAKDIFMIFASSAYDSLKKFIDTNDIEHMSSDELKSSFRRELEKHYANMLYQARQEGIPELFLQKYFMVSEGFQGLRNASVDTLLSTDFQADNYVKIHLIYSVINGTISAIFHNLASTVKSINGDLNGLEYKGVIIGYKAEEAILPPHGVDIPMVEGKMKELMYTLNASRCYIYKFLPYEEFEIGVHSCVYEVVNAGISKEKNKLQKLHNTYLEIYDENQRDVVVKAKNDCNELLKERFKQRGIYAGAYKLLFNGKDHPDGMLVINWSGKDGYEQALKDGLIEQSMNFYGDLLESYIIYSADQKF